MKKLNCIVFGCGRIGKVHINNILNSPNKFNLKYIITPIKLFNTYKNIPLIDTNYYHKILLEEKIDCAFICSPTENHYIQIMDCLSNNLNVFCE